MCREPDSVTVENRMAGAVSHGASLSSAWLLELRSAIRCRTPGAEHACPPCQPHRPGLPPRHPRRDDHTILTGNPEHPCPAVPVRPLAQAHARCSRPAIRGHLTPLHRVPNHPRTLWCQWDSSTVGSSVASGFLHTVRKAFCPEGQNTHAQGHLSAGLLPDPGLTGTPQLGGRPAAQQ